MIEKRTSFQSSPHRCLGPCLHDTDLFEITEPWWPSGLERYTISSALLVYQCSRSRVWIQASSFFSRIRESYDRARSSNSIFKLHEVDILGGRWTHVWEIPSACGAVSIYACGGQVKRSMAMLQSGNWFIGMYRPEMETYSKCRRSWLVWLQCPKPLTGWRHLAGSEAQGRKGPSKHWKVDSFVIV